MFINTAETDEVFFDFLEEHFLSHLLKFPTRFKSVENPSSIDLIITNKHQSFQNTTSFSTGLSDFHKLVVTSMKTTLPKVVQKTIIYRNMKSFERCFPARPMIKVKTVSCGFESIRYLGLKILKPVPGELKELPPLETLQKKL